MRFMPVTGHESWPWTNPMQVEIMENLRRTTKKSSTSLLPTKRKKPGPLGCIAGWSHWPPRISMPRLFCLPLMGGAYFGGTWLEWLRCFVVVPTIGAGSLPMVSVRTAQWWYCLCKRTRSVSSDAAQGLLSAYTFSAPMDSPRIISIRSIDVLSSNLALVLCLLLWKSDTLQKLRNMIKASHEEDI